MRVDPVVVSVLHVDTEARVYPKVDGYDLIGERFGECGDFVDGSARDAIEPHESSEIVVEHMREESGHDDDWVPTTNVIGLTDGDSERVEVEHVGEAVDLWSAGDASIDAARSGAENSNLSDRELV